MKNKEQNIESSNSNRNNNSNSNLTTSSTQNKNTTTSFKNDVDEYDLEDEYNVKPTTESDGEDL